MRRQVKPLPLPTEFDSPERSVPDELEAAVALVRSRADVMSLLNGFPGPAYLLNHHRQVIVANHAGTELMRRFDRQAEGSRIGEGLACVNVNEAPSGCGTGTACRYCGLGVANRQFALRGGTYDAELHVRSRTKDGEVASTFHAHLAPVTVNGWTFRLCALTDISAIRSREALEQIFFHDVLNTAQAVQGAATLIPSADDAETLGQLARVVRASSSTLVCEIQDHRDLMQAEDGALTVHLAPESAGAIVTEAVELYRQSRFGQGRVIELHLEPGDDIVDTSRAQLSRSVGNLIKNALEASAPGETVGVRVSVERGEVVIRVTNAAVMPDHVKSQIFQRFFSTKARSGRGLGTYSVRLLVTRYLGGRVDFTSEAPEGTTFTIRLKRS